MKYSLTDVSIVTMIGFLPEIINANNDAIDKEFKTFCDFVTPSGSVVSKPLITADSSSNNVVSINGKFKNLSIDGRTFSPEKVEVILNVADKVNALDTSVRALWDERSGSTVLGSNGLYGNSGTRHSSGDMLYGAIDSYRPQEYDLSSFFSVTGSGSVENLSVSDLYHSVLYRTVKNVRIPLQVGTITEYGQLKTIVYHDHIERSGNTVNVQRLYAVVSDNIQQNSLVQEGKAVTVILNS